MNTIPGFGRLVRELRGSMNQNELARKLHVSRSLVANIETGHSRPSEDFLERVVEIFPTHEVALRDAYRTLPRKKKGSGFQFADADRFAQGRINTMIRVGRSREAERGIEHALKSKPQPIQRLWLMKRFAEVALQRGDPDTAIARYRDGIRAAIEEALSGWETSLRVALVSHLLFHDQLPEAHLIVDEGLARNAENGSLWRWKGGIYWHQHEYPAAYACLMTAEAFGVSTGEIDWDRGCVLAEWGHYSAAIVDLTHALNRRMTARDHANARAVRAFAYGQLGDFELAMSEFKAAEEVVGDNAWLHYYRAICCLTHGRNDLALAGLRHALTLPTGLSTLKEQHARQLISKLETKPESDAAS